MRIEFPRDRFRPQPRDSKQLHTPIEGDGLRVISDLIPVDAVELLTPHVGVVTYGEIEYIKKPEEFRGYEGYVLRGFIQADNEWARAVFSPPLDSVGLIHYREEIKEVGDHRWPQLTQFFLLPKDELTELPPSSLPAVADPYLGRTWTRISGEEVELDDPALKPLFYLYSVKWYDCEEPYNDWEYDKETGVAEQKQHSIVAGDGDPGEADQVYLGMGKSLKISRTPGSVLDIFRAAPGRDNIPGGLPPELISITAEWSTASSEGSYEGDCAAFAVGLAASTGGSERANAQSSASFIPDVGVRIREYNAVNLPVKRYYFYLPWGSEESDIIDKLEEKLSVTINPWPVFKPESVTVSLKGGKIAVSSQADASSNNSYNMNAGTHSYANTWGTGDSYDVSRTHATKNIPPTLHGTPSISGATSQNESINAESSVNITWESSGPPIPPSIVKNKTTTGVINASISVIGAATSPTAIPKSGLYLMNYDIRGFDKDHCLVIATVIDMSIFA